VICRVSNTPENSGYLVELFYTRNPAILPVSWKFHGAMVFVAFDMMQQCLLWLDDTVIGE